MFNTKTNKMLELESGISLEFVFTFHNFDNVPHVAAVASKYV